MSDNSFLPSLQSQPVILQTMLANASPTCPRPFLLHSTNSSKLLLSSSSAIVRHISTIPHLIWYFGGVAMSRLRRFSFRVSAEAQDALNLVSLKIPVSDRHKLGMPVAQRYHSGDPRDDHMQFASTDLQTTLLHDPSQAVAVNDDRISKSKDSMRPLDVGGHFGTRKCNGNANTPSGGQVSDNVGLSQLSSPASTSRSPGRAPKEGLQLQQRFQANLCHFL